jgi:hypothetical protein
MLKKAAISCFLLVSFFAFPAFAVDLTGTWHADDGGTYYIRQIGSEVWWFGENDKVSPSFSNVAHGSSDDFALLLNWADVPKGVTTSSGLLAIEIISSTEMQAAYQSGGFSGTHWTR